MDFGYIYLAKYVVFMSKAELTSKRKADSMSRLFQLVRVDIIFKV